MTIKSWLVLVVVTCHSSARMSSAAEQVHVLCPGFLARELPVSLSIANRLAFAPDGRIFLLGCDGRVHVLLDTDGDGIEDRAVPFWTRPTIQVPAGMVWAPEGIYIASRGKISLLVDENGDGAADREDIIAADWTSSDNPPDGLDAIGLARDAQGGLYFGLGGADVLNPYRFESGKARYDLKGERGTIQRISPDRKGRETFCTGVRFTHGLAFNQFGDLFATDQEDARSLPGGDSLDELNWIVPGRHYGFPPRHEAHLPAVVDEPPVVVFEPRPRSARGLVFNVPGPARARFGPAQWQNDAFVAGFSGGDVWRVKLAKSAEGYVGRRSLLALVSLPIADVAVSPRGELYLCCHSALPEQGSSSSGAGRILRVEYVDRSAPQPVAAWAASPIEVRVAFDRKLEPGTLEGLAGGSIRQGDHLRAGERFETRRTADGAVPAHVTAPRGQLRIAGASIDPEDPSVLVLATNAHPAPTGYALSIPSSGVDMDYDLTGCEARWEGARALRWSGWLPTIDVEIGRSFLSSSWQKPFERQVHRSGVLTLRTRLDLSRRLPRPVEEFTIRCVSENPFEIELAGQKRTWTPDSKDVGVELNARWRGQPLDLTARIQTLPHGAELAFRVAYRVEGEASWRPIPPEIQWLPWTQQRQQPNPPSATTRVDLAGGDRTRGEALFFDEKARCSRCHQVGGRGGAIGPDLSNLSARDPGSIYRDIVEPGAAIHPDYVSYSVTLHDGRVVTGIPRSEGVDQVRVTGENAKEILVAREEIADMQPQKISVMPLDLRGEIGDQGIRDLIAFLLARQ